MLGSTESGARKRPGIERRSCDSCGMRRRRWLGINELSRRRVGLRHEVREPPSDQPKSSPGPRCSRHGRLSTQLPGSKARLMFVKPDRSSTLARRCLHASAIYGRIGIRGQLRPDSCLECESASLRHPRHKCLRKDPQGGLDGRGCRQLAQAWTPPAPEWTDREVLEIESTRRLARSLTTWAG